MGLYLGLEHPDYQQAMERHTGQNHLEEAWEKWSDWKTKTVSHSHGLCLATVSILVGIIMPRMVFSALSKNILGIILISGTILQPVFGWMEIRFLLAMGGILNTIGILMSFTGLVRRFF